VAHRRGSSPWPIPVFPDSTIGPDTDWPTKLTREEARAVLSNTEGLALTYAGRGGVHPLENVDRSNPRPGLRRWVAVNIATGERSRWKEAWLSIHHDGSTTLAAAVGGHRMTSHGYFEGSQVQSAAIECSIADLMALIRATAEATGNDEYDVRVGTSGLPNNL
jgi:hypothetical protein